MTPRTPLVEFLLAALVAGAVILFGACSDGDGEGPGTPASTVDAAELERFAVLAQKARDEVARATTRSWASGLWIRKHFLARMNAIHPLLVAARAETPPDAERLGELRARLAALTSDGLWATLRRLEELEDLLDRAERTQEALDGALRTMNLPAGLPFEPRTRFLEGWAPQRIEVLNLLDQGLRKLLEGEGDQEFRIAGAALLRLDQERADLVATLVPMARDAGFLVAGVRQAEELVAWLDEILVTGGERLPTADRDAVEGLRSWVADQLPALRQERDRIIGDLALARPNARGDYLHQVRYLQEELPKLLLETGIPIARRLGMKDPPVTMTSHQRLALVLLALLLPACSGQAGEDTVLHIVLFKLEDPSAGPRLLAETRTLVAGLPDVRWIGGGPPLGIDRPGVEGDWDVALILGFPDRAAYASWLAHSGHQRLVNAWRGQVRETRVLDIDGSTPR